MSKSHRFFLAAVLVIAVIAVVLLRGQDPDRAPDAGSLGSASPELEIYAANPAGTIKTDSSKPSRDEILTIRPLDFLSRKPLDLPKLSLVSGSNVVELTKEAGVSPVAFTVPASLLEREEASWSWSYEVPFTTRSAPWTVPLAQSAPDKDGQVFLPYHGGVRGIVLHGGTREPFENVKVKVFFLAPSNIEKLARQLDQDPHDSRESLRSLPFLLEYYEDRFGEVKKVEASTDSRGAFSLILPFSGQPTLELYEAKSSAANYSAMTHPGQWTNITKNLWKRPRIHGTVRDASGDPVPNVNVGVMVVLSYVSPDLSLSDNARGFAIFQGSSGSPTGHPLVGAKKNVRTDRLGEYSMVFPRGNRYAASAITDSAMDFVETHVADPNAFDELVLDLKLVPKSNPSLIRFQLENGEPVVNAKVTILYQDDGPWFRDFPELTTDKNGLVTIPWMGPLDNKYGFALHSEELARIFSMMIHPGSTVITVPMKYVRAK